MANPESSNAHVYTMRNTADHYTQVLGTKIDSVGKWSLSDDSLSLLPSTCDRDTFARVLCPGVLLRTLCVPSKLVNYGKVGSHPWSYKCITYFENAGFRQSKLQ